MVTSARRCAGCGSPLPETADHARQITCAFCGLVNELANARGHAPQPVQINVDVAGATRAAASAGKTIALVVLAVVVLSVGSGLYIAFRATSQVATTVREVTRTTTDAMRQARTAAAAASRPQKIAAAALAAPGSFGWRELDVPVPTSGWSAFEPVTDLTWAMAIARAWQPDARVTRIDVERLRDTGTIDLTAGPDNSAGYRFTSPAQIENWERIADRDSKASVPYELLIKIAEQKVTALVSSGQPRRQELPPAAIDSHPLPELLARAKKGRGFAEHPFYSGYLIHLEREGWVWYLNSLSRRDSIPRVRARDGAVFPYR